jgi:hypothetical protein
LDPSIGNRAILENNLWVPDLVTTSFAPTRFVAYSGLTLSQYSVRRPQIDGQKARRVVERVTGLKHNSDDDPPCAFQSLLARWVLNVYGSITHDMEIYARLYKFLVLPVPLVEKSNSCR